jgi:hypothetical protein
MKNATKIYCSYFYREKTLVNTPSNSCQYWVLATLGEGLGCVLIKSTLGFRGSPEGRDAGNNGEQWGTGGQFTSNLGLKRTLASQQEGAK